MPHRSLIALGLALALAGCSSKTDTSSTTNTAAAQRAGDFTISTTFSPAPPNVGSETITIGLEDATGSPVSGASVTIATNMPNMSMAGPTLTASDNGDGTYSARTNLNYATRWTFDVRAQAGAKSGHVTIAAEVK